jgi:hemolysin activation/secretion protein
VQNLAAAADSGFVIVSPALASFNQADLNKRLAAGKDRPIEGGILEAIKQVLENFFRMSEYPAATAIVPTQNIDQGDVRVVITLGSQAKTLAATEWKIRKINIQGTRWFSESLLRDKLRIEQGGMIRYSDLDSAIGWTNNNPFRRVKVQLDPVPNTSGEADLTVAVQDVFPLRLTASYSNSGNEAVGKNQYVAAVSYGNLWGLDHQVSYQYITTDRPKFFQGHGFDYRVPLPWRHYVQLSASYVLAKPDLFAGFFQQKGETITTDLRYTVPLRSGESPIEAYAALSFKESNNNIAYGGTQVLGTKTDIFQLTTGASLIRRDKRGIWAFGASITASPGKINSRNTDEAFDAGHFDPSKDSARFGSNASYLYGSLSVQRLLSIMPGWDVSSRAVFQAAQTNLLPSEELSIGGAASVRGFPENVYQGDHGYLVSTDLLGPSWKQNLPYISKTRGPLETRPLVFFDMGNTGVHEKFATDPKHVPLASAGVGLRMSLATNFSLSADYGWQITYLPFKTEEKPHRGHIKATLAF